MKRLIAVTIATFLTTLGITVPAANSATSLQFTADVWADNWFAMYVNGVKVAVDPIPISTPRSFNKVSLVFTASYPLMVAIISKDYVESKSGLEYIGTSQQQIGDAGLIAQFHEKASGKYVGGTSASWKTLPIFQAPLNADCETSDHPDTACKWKTISVNPAWFSKTYSDKSWGLAKTYSEQAVGVKDGYLEVDWNPAAKLIWSKSLEIDNTVLFRTVFKAPVSGASSVGSSEFGLIAPYLKNANTLEVDNTCDGSGVMPTIQFENVPAVAKSLALTLDTAPGPPRIGEPVQTDFYHLVAFNISPLQTFLEGNLAGATIGRNFKGAVGYTPPCSQGPGLKTYTFHLYALSDLVTVQPTSGQQLLDAISGKILASATLNLYYTR